MNISGAMAISVQGITAQSVRLSTSANNMANIDTPGYRRSTASSSALMPGGVATKVSTASATAADPATSNVDPLQEAVTEVESRAAFQLNADAFETGADMWQALASMKRD
ncbi:flagellar basal body protein [Rhizobium sp. BK376]|uniref:flagellar basal body protein n=1 Tax=Rhizobium sp. BK376 TaxID=2512149 RepID=UPI00104503B8|nr:flagellar basal body protein [Rhizobium sp. BK376]TCR85254.1 flagellar basal-body rod protein FlgC [Rhizobium sp. BK376]